MKRHWIEHTQEWAQGPMTYWIHVPSCAEPCQLTRPPPAWVPGKGYPVYYVEVDRFLAANRQRGSRLHLFPEEVERAMMGGEL